LAADELHDPLAERIRALVAGPPAYALRGAVSKI